NGLAALGVEPGQHVAIVGENRPRLYLSMMAAQTIGAIPVPLYQDAVAQEMLYVLQDAEIRVCVVENQEQVDKMLEAAEQCPALTYVVYDDPRGLRNYQQERLLGFERLLELGREYALAHPAYVDDAMAAIQPDDAAAMFSTSGPTGQPQGVMLSHHALNDG